MIYDKKFAYKSIIYNILCFFFVVLSADNQSFQLFRGDTERLVASFYYANFPFGKRLFGLYNRYVGSVFQKFFGNKTYSKPRALTIGII